VVPAVVNVRELLYVIWGSMSRAGEERVMSRPALTGRKMNAEKADPARGAAGRPRRDGGASANLRVRVGGGNFCFEGSGYDYRGGCDGGSSGGGRR
jgi:hypothetical protein